MKESRIFDDAVVRMPRTHMLSLSAIGTPASGPSRSPAARCRSMAAARSSARSAATWLKALSAGFTADMRSSVTRHASTAEMLPAAMS